MRKKEINNEQQLMEGFRDGQQNCFAEVFNLLYAPLCNYAMKYTQDNSAAEDIVEDAFVKIWEKRNMFYDLPVLKSYFYTTVRNASLNWIKSNTKFSPLSDIKIDELQTEEQQIFQYALQAETYNQLARALEHLSPQAKKIIRMIFFEGKKTRAVAEELGISQSTVKTHKERAILSLQKQFPRQ